MVTALCCELGTPPLNRSLLVGYFGQVLESGKWSLAELYPDLNKRLELSMTTSKWSDELVGWQDPLVIGSVAVLANLGHGEYETAQPWVHYRGEGKPPMTWLKACKQRGGATEILWNYTCSLGADDDAALFEIDCLCGCGDKLYQQAK